MRGGVNGGKLACDGKLYMHDGGVMATIRFSRLLPSLRKREQSAEDKIASGHG